MAGFVKLALTAPYISNKPPLRRPEHERTGWNRSDNPLAWYSIEADVHAQDGREYDISAARDSFLNADSVERSGLVRAFFGKNLTVDLIYGLTRTDLRRVLSPLLEWRDEDEKVSEEIFNAALTRAEHGDLSKTGCTDVLRELYNAEKLDAYATTHRAVIATMVHKALGGGLETHIGQIPQLKTVCVLVAASRALGELTLGEQHAVLAVHPTSRAVTLQGYISWIAQHGAEFDGADWLTHLAGLAIRAGNRRGEILSGVLAANFDLIAGAAAGMVAEQGRLGEIVNMWDVPVGFVAEHHTWDGPCALLDADTTVHTWNWVSQLWQRTNTRPSTGAAAVCLGANPGLIGLVYAVKKDADHAETLVGAANLAAKEICCTGWLNKNTASGNKLALVKTGHELLENFETGHNLLTWLLTTHDELFTFWCAGRFAANLPTVEKVMQVAPQMSASSHISMPHVDDVFSEEIFDTLVRFLPGIPWHLFCYGGTNYCSKEVTQAALTMLAEHVDENTERWAELDKTVSAMTRPSAASIADVVTL